MALEAPSSRRFRWTDAAVALLGAAVVAVWLVRGGEGAGLRVALVIAADLAWLGLRRGGVV